VKFGFDLRLLQQNAYRDIESHGFFNFTGLLLGNRWRSCCWRSHGDRRSHGKTIRSTAQPQYDFFATDTWRVRPDLLLTLGIVFPWLRRSPWERPAATPPAGCPAGGPVKLKNPWDSMSR